jgi:hypothetical protein
MSGPADALTQFVTDPKRQIVAIVLILALQNPQGNSGGSVFSLDKYLSWMPHTLPYPSLDLGQQFRLALNPHADL